MQPSSDDRAPEFRALAELGEVFTALVSAFTDRHTTTLRSEQIVDLAARCMPSAEHTGLVVEEHGRARTVAASSPVAEQLEAIRRQTGEGPALDVLEINELVTSGDLAQDARWPRFGPRACDELSIRSVATYRLYLGPSHRAALTFLSWWPSAFDDVALTIGSIFAAYCSLTLFAEAVLADELAPRRAAEVHREIGTAVGILMATEQVSVDEAYQRLHRASRELHQSLYRTARDVVDPGPAGGPPPRSG